MGSRGLDLPAESKSALKEYLQYMIQGDDGFINCKDIPLAFAALGYEIQEKDIESLRELFDTNQNITKHIQNWNDRRLHIDEILDNLDVINIHASESQLTKDKITAAFKMFDKGEDGFIRQHEFVQVLTAKLPNEDFKFGKEETLALWKDLLAKYDRDEDGKLNYCEFVRMFYNSEEKFLQEDTK